MSIQTIAYRAYAEATGGRDGRAISSDGVLDVALTDGTPLRVGDVICFELAYDDTVYQAVRGSEVLVVQSNNATYRGTAQIVQQFAITHFVRRTRDAKLSQ